MSHFALVLLVVGIVLVTFVALGFRGDNTGSSTAAGASAGTGRDRLAADIRATRTSRVADEVAIVDELVATNPGFRQYCELVGTAQASGGVTAPYSRSKVAYYEIRCYRIENHGNGDVETLVAHECSLDPFYFTDGSGDTPVYVDLDSFGDDVILVNSANHIEGPHSDFAQAAASSQAKSGASDGVMAVVATAAAGAGAIVSGGSLCIHRPAMPVTASDRMTRRMTRLMRLAAARLLTVAHGLTATVTDISAEVHIAIEGAVAFFVNAWGVIASRVDAAIGRALTPPCVMEGTAYACITLGMHATQIDRPQLLLARGYGHGGPARRDGRGPGGPDRPGARSRGSGGPRNAPLPVRPGSIPPGLGRFLGGMEGPYSYGGAPRSRPRGTANDMLTGMALGTLLATLAKDGGAGGGDAPASTLRGYRLVEDVVPLGSPVYCIGELHRSGERYVMGRSLSDQYPTSYFATRPEAEVLSRLGG